MDGAQMVFTEFWELSYRKGNQIEQFSVKKGREISETNLKMLFLLISIKVLYL
jgi:hypothetical protein